MTSLQRLIRELILEVYEMTPEDEETLEYFEKKTGSLGNAGKRALGLQSKKEIKRDREWMQHVQDTMGREGVKSFMDRMHLGGDFTILHSIRYSGAASRANAIKSIEGFDKGGSPEAWIKKHGRRGKDTLSCIGVPKPIDQINGGDFHHLVGTNAYQVLAAPNTMGFIMKGYPVMVSNRDVMSQTLSAIPKGLEQHQKNSGIAKRAGPGTFFYRNYDEFMHDVKSGGTKVAEEVLLDNWEVIGLYAKFERGPTDDSFKPNIETLDKDWQEICSYFKSKKSCMTYFYESMLEAWDNLADDKVIELGLDWVYNDKTYGGLMKIIDESYDFYKMTIDSNMASLPDDVLKPMFETTCKVKLRTALEENWEIYTRHSRKHPVIKPHLQKHMETMGKKLSLPVFFL